MKLALGTVQFGMNYGISNTKGKPDVHTIESTLIFAKSQGINILDTAYSYGRSEEILGSILLNDNTFQIITKTAPIAYNGKIRIADIEKVQRRIDKSFERLKKSKLYGILVHHGEELLVSGGERFYHTLMGLRSSKQIQKIGVSVSSPELLDQIIDRFPIDLVQVPLNLLDQRMMRTGMLQKLRSKNIEIHTRSAFLQGVLINSTEQLPPYFNKIYKQLQTLNDVACLMQVSKMVIALQFLKQIKEIDQIIIGVQNTEQLRECVASYAKEVNLDDFNLFNCNETSILDPSKWIINGK